MRSTGRKSFVIRAGFATKFYPEALYNWNDTMTGNTPFSATYQNSTTDATQTPDGIANYAMRSVPTIIAGKNSQDAVSLSTATRTDRRPPAPSPTSTSDQPTSRVHTWNFTLEKEVLPQTVLRIGYVGIHGTHDDETYPDRPNHSNLHLVRHQGRRAADRAPTPAVLQKPYDVNPDGSVASSVFGTVQELRKTGYSWTNGIQLEVEHRYNKGFQYQIPVQHAERLCAWAAAAAAPTTL